MKNPKISFIICTYNSLNLIKRCLKSIEKQKYSGKREIILVDGGSDGKTMGFLKSFVKSNKDVRLLINKGRFPEGYGKGKWFGWKNTTGEFVAIVDQDNELSGDNWIKDMLKPFDNKDVFGVACKLKLDPKDNLFNQYMALQGTDPFMAYRSLDGKMNLETIGKSFEDYHTIKLDKRNLLITGGNCFIYRKSSLDGVGGYIKDIENIYNLSKSENNLLAVSKKARTHHLAVKGLFDFIKKKNKWGVVYPENREKEGFSYFPKTRRSRKEMLINLFLVFSIIPNFFVGVWRTLKYNEKAWVLHPIITFLTGWVYLINFLFSIKFINN